MSQALAYADATDDASRHGIGGNKPPSPLLLSPTELRQHMEIVEKPLVDRKDALLAEVPGYEQPVTTDEEYAAGSDFAKQIQAHINLARDRFTPAKKPYLEGGRVVDAFFKDVGLPLQAALAKVHAPMTIYAEEKERKERARVAEIARAAKIEADRIAKAVADAARLEAEQEAEREAARQASLPPPAPIPLPQAPTMDHAIAAANIAQAAEKAANARPADYSRVRGDYGSVSSLRELITVELEDLSKVPLEFLTFNESAARRAAQAGRADIPGVKIIRSKHVQTR